MADEQIEILIKAVDEVSATVKKIEGNLDGLNQTVTKQSESTTRAFQTQVTTLLTLGNVASSVDNIFSSYTNLQLRLENATERVIGAQDRLRNAQERLTTAQKDNERVNLSLEKLGIQEERSKKKLADLNHYLALRIKGKLNPASYEYKRIIEQIQDEELNLKDIQLSRTELVEKQNTAVTSAQREVEAATRQTTIAENNLARANNAVYGTYINMGTSALSAVSSLTLLTTSMTGAGGAVEASGLLAGAVGIGGLAATLGAAGALVGMIFVMQKIGKVEMPPFIKALDDEILKLKQIESTATGINLQFAQMIRQQKEVERIAASMGQKSTTNNPKQGFNSKFDLPAGYLSGGDKGITFSGFHDFIQRPGQPATNFHPNDTVIGVKNPDSLKGGGMTLIIEGDVYGTDPDQMADAIFKKLRRKILV